MAELLTDKTKKHLLTPHSVDLYELLEATLAPDTTSKTIFWDGYEKLDFEKLFTTGFLHC